MIFSPTFRKYVFWEQIYFRFTSMATHTTIIFCDSSGVCRNKQKRRSLSEVMYLQSYIFTIAYYISIDYSIYVTVNLWKPCMSTYAEIFRQCRHTLVKSAYVDIIWNCLGNVDIVYAEIRLQKLHRLTKMVLGDYLSNKQWAMP